MLLCLLNKINRDSQSDMVCAFFVSIKRWSVLLGSDVTEEVKLLDLIERLVHKFIKDRYTIKIDRDTMQIVAEINDILEKQGSIIKKREVNRDNESETNTTRSCDDY